MGSMLFGFLRFLMSWGVDLQADSLVNPPCFKVHIKCSKTDPFRLGCDIYVEHGEGSVCPIQLLGSAWLF